MADTEKRWFWVGKGTPRIDSVPIRHGDEIDPSKVHPSTWGRWEKNGDVSNASVAVKVKDKDPKAEADLKFNLKEANAKNKALTGEVKNLKADLEKAKSGKKADELKKLKENAVAQSDHIEKLETIGTERAEAMTELEQDVAEKDALIKKQAEEIEGLKKDLDAATAPDTGGNDDSGGPG